MSIPQIVPREKGPCFGATWRDSWHVFLMGHRSGIWLDSKPGTFDNMRGSLRLPKSYSRGVKGGWCRLCRICGAALRRQWGREVKARERTHPDLQCCSASPPQLATVHLPCSTLCALCVTLEGSTNALHVDLSTSAMESAAGVPYALPGRGCQNCRHRKSKCDRRRPSCDFCVKASVPCRYVGGGNKPGLRAGYVQRLEGRLATLESEFADFKQRLGSPSGPVNTTDSLTHARQSGPADCGDSEVNVELGQESLAATAFSGPPVQVAVAYSCDFWFQHYHPWLPILHQPTLRALAESCTGLDFSALPMVLKATVVAMTAHESKITALDFPDSIDVHQRLRKDIISDSLYGVSCTHLQSLLILAVVVFGEGSIPEFWNLISLCKRMSMQLGLRDLVIHYGDNYDKPSTLPPRMLLVPSTDVDLEERIRAFWVTEIFDSASTIGASWNLPVSAPELCGLSPCGDDEWSMPQGQVRMFASSTSNSPSAFGLYVQVVSNEIWHAHKFHQEVCDTRDSDVYARRQTQCQAVVDTLIRRLQEIRHSSESVSPQAISSVGGTTRDVLNANTVLTYCVLHMTVITLFQRMILPPNVDADSVQAPWQHAVTRCRTASDSIISILREFPDELLECANPQLSICLFVAARFYIIHARYQQAQTSPRVHFLIYTLQCCGQMWRLAGRLCDVLHAAVETTPRYTGVESRPLPVQFWDLGYSWQDIDHALQLWDLAGAEMRDTQLGCST